VNSQPLVTTIVVNRDGLAHLQRCLPSLLAQRYEPQQLILVDNGSRDASVAYMRATCPQAQIITLTENRGFAAANNLAIRQAKGDFIALLNNDAFVEPDWLESLVSVARRDERIGMVASKMLFVAPRGVVNSAGICVDRVGIAWDRLGGTCDNADQQVVEVFGACAGAAPYRRALFDDIGLFDEDFFAYLEDVDLAWRAQLAGWRALYAPAARVTHWHSATSVEGSPFKSRSLGRNKLWLILKNYPSPYLWYYLPLIVAYDVAAVAGDNVGYLIGHFGGRRLVLRFGRYVFVTEKRLTKAEDFFGRHGGKIVAVARFIDGLRQLNGIVAGIAGMPWQRFLAFNALGAAAWVGVWTSVGYFAGGHLTAIYNGFHRYQVLALLLAGAVIVAVLAHWLWRRRRQSGTPTHR